MRSRPTSPAPKLDRVSAQDTNNYRDTELNWARARRRYGAVVAAYGAPCKVALGAPVTSIDHSGTRVKIDTTRGEVTARAVIVAVPTPMIANETIRFTPALPDKVAAAQGLPLGVANKMLFLLTTPDDYPPNAHLRGGVDRPRRYRQLPPAPARQADHRGILRRRRLRPGARGRRRARRFRNQRTRRPARQ